MVAGPRKAGWILLPAGLASLLSCTSPSPTANAPETVSSKLSASGKVFRMGSEDRMALPEELPGFVRFEYDFQIDSFETTQSRYRALMGRNPSKFQGDSLPVTDVSWFDALLYCNARSRADGLDTVYEYSSASFGDDRSAWSLGGLVAHYERDGWRLPTEAEWEFAARSGSSRTWPWGELGDSGLAGTFAWYQANSDAHPHPIGSLAPNAWGLYDMQGNVMEWVADWKGPHPADTVVNYAGPEAPGAVAESPLKGGSWSHDLAHLRPASRSATYAAFRSNRTSYVGFRCVRGAFHPRYSASGGNIALPPAVLTGADPNSLTHRSSARLVFVRRANGSSAGTLSWVDYGEANPVVRSLPDADPAFHPVLSPDGRWVAWTTAMEGSRDPGRIKIRRLSADSSIVLETRARGIPRWWVSGDDTFLVAGASLDNLASEWASEPTLARPWSGGVLADPAATWSPRGAYHDGRSGPFLYTGYRRLRRFDLRDGTEKTLFVGPGNGKESNDTSQVCNVSAAPDSSGRVLFLDFGSSSPSTLVGRRYGIHEIAFLMGSSGEILRTLPVPDPFLQWDHLEWSTSSQWAVATALPATPGPAEIRLLDLDEGGSSPLVRGEGVAMPHLWLPEREAIARQFLDSAGRYEEGWSGNDEFAAKLRIFWGMADSVQAVFLGSSKFRNGIVPGAFALPTANLGYGYGSTWETERILRDIILPHAPRLKVVGLSLMAGWMFWPQRALWESGPSRSTGYRFDASHRFWVESIPEDFRRAVALRHEVVASDGVFDAQGGGSWPSAGWGMDSPVDGTFPDSIFDLSSPLYAENLACFARTLDALDSAGVLAVVANLPMSPRYGDQKRAGFFEPTWQAYHAVLSDVRDLVARHPRARFFDAHLDGAHDFGEEDALDPVHLSSTGGLHFSRVMDSLLGGWLVSEAP